ncbi:MAG: protein kinase [Verrucomicrobiota bacterium]|jgi:WD40 repeat protein/serine/threonine protein kinase
MTTPSDRELTLFSVARQLPERERSAFLDQACADDPALRQCVEDLLQAIDVAGDFLEGPAADSFAPDGTVRFTAKAAEMPGDKIGHYKLLQQIGEGGCGVVYMAEQEAPVRRRVALKVIKLGMDTKQVIARFEAERQALALMDHPNIAKVLDAGATDKGRPYFVMELVRGVKITDYCDKNNLPTRERLLLFVQVCQAIQHAHQKGIIHRDIKPSNILVTLRDGVPVPKVIDFGIAKATTDQRLTDKTLFTAFEQFIGTPTYMSPEQAEMSELGIDTRSDIYSLGVLLYELLTGQTPFDSKVLLQAGLDEIRRIIREQEPVRPSTRLSTMLAGELTTTAQRRQTEPAKLSGLLRGDLDWIVMKCLEKDRARRYETANGLTADLDRHLKNEPVMARPPTGLYKLQKFARRNKLAVVAVGAVAAALIIGLGVSTWMFIRERNAHQEAAAAEREQSRLRETAQQTQARETLLRRQAEAAELAERQKAYASDMNVAFQAWDKGDVNRVDRLLDEHRPKPSQDDLRGFEWFYLWRLIHSDQLTLRGHNAYLRAVAFSTDGDLLATAGDDSTTRIWDAHTGKIKFALGGHTGGVTAVAFSPDGKVLATGGADKLIVLWDVATGAELSVLRGHNYGVTSLAFEPDGKWLASADGKLANGGDRNPLDKYVDTSPLMAEVKLWNVETRKTILTLSGNTNSILSLAISPNGKTLATGGADATVKLWEIDTGKMRTNLAGFKGPVFAVAFSPDGHSLAVGGGNPYREQAELKIMDPATCAERVSFKGHDGPVFALAFSPDSKTLASGGLDQIIRLWNVTTGDEVQAIKGHRASIWSLAWNPSGERIASASWDQTVKVWDAVQQQGQQVFPGPGSFSGCFSPDGKYLIRSGWRLKVIEIGTTNPPYLIPDYFVPDAVVAVSPDGSTMASGGMGSSVTLWEVGTWRRLATLPGPDANIYAIAFSPDSRTLAFSDVSGVRLWDVHKRVERAFYQSGTEGASRVLAFTSNGRTLIVTGERGGGTCFLDPTTAQVQKVTEWDGVAVSSDGRYLAVDRSGLGLLDLNSMELKWLVNAHRAQNWSAHFSPDGRTLATASWDGTAQLLNVASGQEMFNYRAPGVVWDALFSPDSKWWSVGSGSAANGEMALFRSATPEEVEADDAPVIYTQPTGQSSSEGRTVTLQVSATGASPLSYQWRRGVNSIPGETNSALTLADVTETNAGDYSVMISNALGSTTSSNATLNIRHLRETLIAEVNFQAKQPAWSNAFTYSENPVPLSTNISEIAGAGADGGAALVLRADGSGFSNNMSQANSGFGLTVGAFASRTNGIDTTNLSLYKVYATIRATGVAGKSAAGRVQSLFMAPHRPILGIEIPVTFTTNFQVYSFILSDGVIDTDSDSWNEFATNLDAINALQLAVVADQWLVRFHPDANNGFYLSNIKFMRLVPPRAIAPNARVLHSP